MQILRRILAAARTLGRAGRARATTRPCSPRRTGAWSRRPTRSCTAPTSASHGRAASTSAGRRRRSTSPTSRRWAPGRPRCWSRWRCPTTRALSFVEQARRRPARRVRRARARAARSRAATSPSRTRSRSPSPRSARSTVARPCCAAAPAPGDVVAVAGELGVAGRGLGILFERFRDAAGEPVPIDRERARRRRRPRPSARSCAPRRPIALGAVAADAGATAMMDVSDGLVLDASRLAAASGVTDRHRQRRARRRCRSTPSPAARITRCWRPSRRARRCPTASA